MDVMGSIEKLIGAEIKEPEALVAEAEERIREYFEAENAEKWELCSPTYRSKYTRENFITACEDWFPLVKSFRVINVSLPSGILATVAVEIEMEGHTIERKISLMKEKSAYQPDPDAPYYVVGNTAPPYCLS